MNVEQQIQTLATLVADVKHIATSVEEIRTDIKGLVNKAELEQYVKRTEFEQLRDELRRGSPKTLFRVITEISLGFTAIVTAGAAVVALIKYIHV